MRKDAGLSTDVDRTPQLSWMLFLKFFDDLEQQNKTLNLKYRSAIEKPYRWRDWASNDEGITGNELIKFVNDDLIPHLRELKGTKENDSRDVLSSLFSETYNRMLSGYLFREIINLIDDIDFKSKDDIFTLSHLYESMLKEMRDAAGTSGEFYTPRPVVRFIVKHIKPRLGEKVLDPACGTGGFLVEAYEYMKKQAKSSEDYDLLQYKTLYGIEKKPMPYLLGTMNLMLHGIETPNIQRRNTLTTPLREIAEKDKYDVIITNPPFGGEEEKGIQSNFPMSMRTSETALLFIQYIMRSLKKNGRCGIVVPNSFMFGTGVEKKVKELLIKEHNLTSVIRFPKGVFEPYSDIETNVLFFDGKGTTRDNILYYFVDLPKGRKQYTKTRPLAFSQLDPCLRLLSDNVISKQRLPKTNESFYVQKEKIVGNNYNLDVKNINNRAIVFNDFFADIDEVLKSIDQCKKILTEIKKTEGKEHQIKTSGYKLGDFLSRSKNKITLEDSVEYTQVTVRLYGKGVIVRGKKLGRDIGTKNQYVISPTQFIISRIDARNGAFGIIPPELDGAIVTGDFPVFDIDTEIVDRDYFSFFVKSQQLLNACIASSRGTTNRKRLKEDIFLSFDLLLPSLQKQQKIAVNLKRWLQPYNHNSNSAKQFSESLMNGLISKYIPQIDTESSDT
jgi:type I restriction enzyme M protein